MNRRSFISSIATAVAGFSILPAALTYQRTWKFSKESGLVYPLYISCSAGEWSAFTDFDRPIKRDIMFPIEREVGSFKRYVYDESSGLFRFTADAPEAGPQAPVCALRCEPSRHRT